MNIVFVASECAPYAKTGGLADVAGTLPVWLQARGHDIRIFMPKYRGITVERYHLQPLPTPVPVTIQHSQIRVPVWKGMLSHRVPVYFVEHDSYYNREYLYGTPEGDYADNDLRFIFFTRTVFTTLKQIGFKPDIIHCNDWQTGFFPLFLRMVYRHSPFFKTTKSIFTIHNIAYQGIFNKKTLEKAELSGNVFTVDGLEFHNHVSFLKAGIVYSDRITTVSPTYAQEIQLSKEFGYGMEGILRKRSKDLSGIINGIDYHEWNPKTDQMIPSTFTAVSLGGKKKCKKELQKKFNLEISPHIPCIGIVSRLAAQKGFDLLSAVLGELLNKGIQLVILGTGDRVYHQKLLGLAEAYPGKLGLSLRFDNALAHGIYAGSDFFMMPSRFEPCGLGQMIAMRYGTIPIVMRTGGLTDTVIDYRNDPHKGNGIVIEAYDARELLDTAISAVEVWQDAKKRQKLLRNIFKTDFQWKTSAKKYESLYQSLIQT